MRSDELANIIRTTLDEIEPRTSASAFQNAAEIALVGIGLTVDREILVALPGRRRSRVDLVVNGWFAVELDRKTPRSKSLAKVRTFGAGMVYCRER